MSSTNWPVISYDIHTVIVRDKCNNMMLQRKNMKGEYLCKIIYLDVIKVNYLKCATLENVRPTCNLNVSCNIAIQPIYSVQ